MIINNTKILCTLGPASFDPQIMKRLEDLGVNLFRINLSHTKIKDLPRLIDHIQTNTKVPICLDTEGAQIRTGDFTQEYVKLRENNIVHACRRAVPGNEMRFNLIPREIVNKIHVGDFISIDFNSVLVQVVARENEDLILRVLNGGQVGRNKAVTIEREIILPPLSKKDTQAIEIGKSLGLSHFALSFANRPSDVEMIRKLTDSNTFIISKIESLSGLANLENIANLSDAILIDRGDLSRQVPLELIPQMQKSIIETGKNCGREVFVATNLLESMVQNPLPTRAEVNDIYNTLLDNADGLVLAAETAIGAYPVECTSMVVKIVSNFENPAHNKSLSFPMEPISLLVAPHGGQLIQQYASLEEKRESLGIRQIEISDTALLDCEQIAHGTYSPLIGFMDSATINHVLDNNTLPNGTVWTMPILLHVREDDAERSKIGEKVTLKGRDGRFYAILEISEVFELDLDELALKWFTTTSHEHPGVARLFKEGKHFLAGEIKLLERQPSQNRHYELTPKQTRFIFAHKGWSRIIGFHTRNPVHRGHEYIQKKALEISGADGLYLNPVVGPKKNGDFKHTHIMKSYQTMLEYGLYPEGKTMLGSFATYSRYGGPREAVYTALCRKNMGCSHFIIGRDHTGVGDFYDPTANERLFKSLGDIGIKPLFFSPVGYNRDLDCYEEETIDNKESLLAIDGTSIRDSLRLGEKVEDWNMREIIQEALLDFTPEGDTMFVTDLDE